MYYVMLEYIEYTYIWMIIIQGKDISIWMQSSKE